MPTSLLELYVVLLRFSFSFNAGRRTRNSYSTGFNRVPYFLLEQLKSHTSEVPSKFEKASTDAECALSVSKQLKVESELKFSYPGNERYYKFNLEVLDHLENFSKALLVQDSAKASLLLNDSIKLMKKM